MQAVVFLSVQSSVGVSRLQRKISQLIQPIGGVRASALRASAAPSRAVPASAAIAASWGILTRLELKWERDTWQPVLIEL